MRSHLSRFVAVVCLFALAVPAFAVTYLVPEDREMIQQADDVVVATALHSHAEISEAGGIVTIAELRIDQVLKGRHNTGDTLRLTTIGGRVADTITLIPGAPAYVDGRRYLVFTSTNGRGEPTTYQIGLGQFELKRDLRGLEYFERAGEVTGFDVHTWEAYVDHPRDAGKFLAYIRGIVAQTAAPAGDYTLQPEQLSLPKTPNVSADAFTVTSYMLLSNGKGLRWQNPSASIVNSGTLGGSVDGPAAVSAGRSAWNGDSNSNVAYSSGGTDNTAVKGLTDDDGKNAVLFGDPNNELGGAAGLGGISRASAAVYQFSGEDFFPTLEIDVVLASGGTFPSQSCINAVTTHEMGHTLGFRHADKNASEGPCAPPLDCANSAIMTAITNCGFNNNLQTWDHTAVSTVYGTGTPTCTAPQITTHPAGSTITAGNQATLTVVATGTGPLTYQWFQGNPPSTTTPVGSNSASIQVSPTSTTTYWVRVTNSCPGSVDSNAATVTVNPPGCPNVNVNNPTAVDLGNGTFQLSVSASGGTGLTYAWFQGSSVGTGTQVGTGNPFTTGVITTQTSFWVRVTNDCNNNATSRNVVTVGPTQCNPLVIINQPQNQTVLTGGTVQLSVGFIGTTPATVLWYRGTPPDTSNLVGSQQTITSPVINATTTFYAKITNACSTVTTNVVTITATQTCNAPAITSASATPSTAQPGTPVTLAVDATGSSLTYQWFRGASGDTSNPISGATSSTFVDTPAAAGTFLYWVKVGSGCGTAIANSNTVTVTITSQCVPPTIAQPTNIEILYGEKATLTVTPLAGTEPLHYAWFQGAKFDTSHPVGTDSPTLVTPSALTQDTQFFVNVSNQCGNINSETITVKVNLPRRRPARK